MKNDLAKMSDLARQSRGIQEEADCIRYFQHELMMPGQTRLRKPEGVENMADYSNMTMAEMEAANGQLMAKRAAIREEQLALNAAMSQRHRKEELARDLAKLREKHGPETQIVVPAGIASGEAVGTPG